MEPIKILIIFGLVNLFPLLFAATNAEGKAKYFWQMFFGVHLFQLFIVVCLWLFTWVPSALYWLSFSIADFFVWLFS